MMGAEQILIRIDADTSGLRLELRRSLVEIRNVATALRVSIGPANSDLSTLQQGFADLRERIAAAREAADSFGATAGELARAQLLAAAEESGETLNPIRRWQINQNAEWLQFQLDRLNNLPSAQELIEQTRTDEERYAADVERIEGLRPALMEILGDESEVNRVVSAAIGQLPAPFEEMSEAAQAAQRVGQQFAQSLGDGLKDIVLRGEDVVAVLMRIGEQLAGSLLEEFVFNPLTEDLGGWIGGLLAGIGSGDEPSGGSGGGGVFGLLGGIAEGIGGVLENWWPFEDGGVMTARGPVPLRRYAGGGIARMPQLALFGEGSRPEAFVPLPDGRSIPVDIRGDMPANDQTGTVINIDARGADASAIAKLERAITALDKQIEPRALTATKRAADGGGAFAKSVGRRA